MRRIHLIHWHADEARQRAKLLKSAGYAVTCNPFAGPASLRALREKPPAAFVISLDRLPSHGRDVALALREMKATRFIPLIFVGGDPEKIARVRQNLPDAAYTSWNRVRSDLRRAIAHPPQNPVVPRTRLDGYSGTPLPQKLGIQPQGKVALVGAPRDFRRTLGELPKGAVLCWRAGKKEDLILWFLRSRRQLTRDIRRMAARIAAGRLWMIWPKKTSGVSTDLSEQAVRETGLAAGLVDYKVCAVDATWSGLLFRPRQRTREQD